MATDTYFVITDGTTTCTFADGSGGVTNYKIADETWSPAVASLRTSELGGAGPYSDVTEEMEIHVTGSTTPAALSNLAALNGLLEQADRWSRGENVAVVLVKYSPKGGTVSTAAAPLQAVVLGRATGDNQAAIQLSPAFEDFLSKKWVVRTRVRFVRRGAWLLGATVDGTSAATANPGPIEITGLATHPRPCPVKITLGTFQFGTALDFTDSLPILITAKQATDIQVVNAESGTTTAYTSVADGGNFALGTNVLRYTPTGTTEAASGEIGLSSMTSGARRFAFFAALRNNSASVSFKIRIAALVEVKNSGSVNTICAYTPLYNIDTTHTRPRFIPLGTLSTPSDIKSCKVLLTASSTAGGPTFDMDYIICLEIDSVESQATQLAAVEGTGFYFHVASISLIDDPLPLSSLSPSVYRSFTATSDIDRMGYLGTAYPLTSSTKFAIALMAKESFTNSYWRSVNTGSATSLTLTANRYNAYLVPE